MLQLEKYSEEDFPLYAQLVFNEQVMRMNLGRVFTPDEAKLFFQMVIQCNSTNTDMGFYKVWRVQDQKATYIGLGAMNWNDDYQAIEIEYMLLPAYWRLGYGTALVELLLERIRQAHQGAEVVAITDPSNLYSQKILSNKNFTLIKRYTNSDGEPALLYRKSI